MSQLREGPQGTVEENSEETCVESNLLGLLTPSSVCPPPPPQLEGEFWEGCLLFSSVLFQDVSARPRCQGWGWQGGVPYTPTKDYFSQSQ